MSKDIATREKQLLDLTQNLNILREREAKSGGNAPLELLNQIEDHRRAIALMEQAIAGQLSEVELEAALKPLLLALRNGQVINITAETYVAGDLVNNITHIVNQALSAVEEAEKSQAVATRRLAEGVRDYALRLQAIVAEDTDADAGGPYKGLLAYRLNDTELFFGREQAIADLLRRLQRGPLTVLHSESGAGKSSLLQAGISPRLLEAGHLPIYLRPYNHSPTLLIKRAFIPDLDNTSKLANAPLQDFLRQVTTVLGVSTTLYFLLDQFEEIFTLLDETSRSRFVDELAACLGDEALNVRWVLAIRSEYFSNLANFRPRIHTPFGNEYRLNRLTRSEAEEVIVAPAARHRIQFEASLIKLLLDDLEQEGVAPPQMQLACLSLYESLQPGETTITQSMYEEQGRTAGILRSHLDRVLKRDLPVDQRAAALRVLEALITSDTRRIIRTFAELAAELQPYEVKFEALRAILNQLVDSRLVRVTEDDESVEPAYELAHDYLINQVELSPEIKARKAAAELLERELLNWQLFGALMRPQTLRVVGAQRSNLQLKEAVKPLLLQSAFETDVDLAQWLTEVPIPLAKQTLLAGLNRVEPELRARAAQYLADYVDDEVTSRLSQLALEDNDPVVRQAALTSLGQHTPEQARQVLLNSLESNNPVRCIEAARLLPAYLDVQVVDRLFACLAHNDNESVWEAVLETLAAHQAEPYRHNWQPLATVGFWRSAQVSQKLRQLRVDLPWSTRLRLLPARGVNYLRQEAQTRRTWLAVRVLLLLSFWIGLFWWLGWGPFRRWELFAGIPQERLSTIEVVTGTNTVMYLGSYDYGVGRIDVEDGWSGWRRDKLPTGEPFKLNDPDSNVKPIWAIAADPQNPDHVYIYVLGSDLFFSSNGGKSWLSLGATGIPINAFYPNLGAWGDVILMINEFGFYGSNNQGRTWQVLTGQNGLGSRLFSMVRFSPTGIPYVINEEGLYYGQGAFPWIWKKIIDVPPATYVDIGPESQLYLALGWPDSSEVACYKPEIGWNGRISFEGSSIRALTAHPDEVGLFYVYIADDQVYEVSCKQGKQGLGSVPGLTTGLAIWPDKNTRWLIQSTSMGLYRRRL